MFGEGELMTTIKSLHLRNFRGAANVSINLGDRTNNRVTTLIGLNESGKTTILEGLSHFPNADKAVASMFQTRETAALAGTFVPIHSTGVFTGEVSIYAWFETSEQERKDIQSIVSDAGIQLDASRPIQNFGVARNFEFKDGDFVESKIGSTWSGIDLYVRKTKRAEYNKFELPPIGTKGRDTTIWMTVVELLRKNLPNVVYFPNIIVDIPRKIYISAFAGETLNNSYYRRVVEHILDDAQDGLSLKTHVMDRVEKYRKGAKDKRWITDLLGSDDKDKIDAVFSRLSSILTDEVLGAWSKVFNRPVSANRVEVKWFVDPENDQPFIQIKVSDGKSSFHLHQRSLGFRWFFSFLLFTRFGRDRERTNIFLFDEPAANLHARAQAEMLNSFNMLAEAGDYVIYSTHSHHMINPSWLPGAYIVENEAIDYDAEDKGIVGQVKDTVIKVTPYRRFVGTNGSRISYYQPVLERLDYREPSLVPSGRQVLLEGASDFYALSYAIKNSTLAGEITPVPGTGSGSLDTLVAIALARGHQFLVLLDDDDAGRKEVDHYRNAFHLTNQVCTLGELIPRFAGKELEDLIGQPTLDLVKVTYGNTKKKSIGLYLAEAAATNRPNALDAATLSELIEIATQATKRLAAQTAT